MRRGHLRHAALALALACLTPQSADADWLLTPFFGSTFKGQTTLVEDLERGAGVSHAIFGGSAGWLSREHIVGVELDVAHAPHFFERSDVGPLVTRSDLTTMTFNVIVAAPLSVTRESLRPYLIGGAGVMHAGIEDVVGRLTLDENVLAMNLGGGAIGFISNRTGLRFDLRHIRTINGPEEALLNTARRNHLSFWRVTMGVVVRY